MVPQQQIAKLAHISQALLSNFENVANSREGRRGDRHRPTA
jgi:hypothetical protein